MPRKNQKKKIKQLSSSLKDLQLTVIPKEEPTTEEEEPSALIEEPSSAYEPIVMDETIDLNLLSKWPKLKMKTPIIFLHKTIDFSEHVQEILKLGVNFYQPYLGTNYTKIFCLTNSDHRSMLKYFDKNQLPYHTFGLPSKRKMKVVIRGLPKSTNLDILQKELKSAGIPIVRVHKMHMKEFAKDRDILVLAVVPYNEEGKKLLQVKKVFGNDVKIEPPNPKTRQCHRCQKWGHSQRYCHGEVKCVKCAGDHYSKKCQRDRDTEPPTCANCGGNHTASYRECFCCPDSEDYKVNRKNKIKNMTPVPHSERQLVTLQNYKEKLYKKVNYIPKHTEAIPF